jgi:Barstar (barnase inhibitor)
MAGLVAVAAFPADDSRYQELDFRLMMNGFITLFRHRAFLEQTLEWLHAHHYHVVRVDASHWSSQADTCDLGQALGFPDYNGRSLDALNDYMGDLASYNHGSSPDATGLVLVLTGYDRFAACCPVLAHAILDIFADQARSAALIGHRMMCLVQSDDPDIRFDPVGATPVQWNDKEALATKRHPDQQPQT